MTEREFLFWLKGFIEIGNSKTINETQVEIIKDHLDLVFNKITPNRWPNVQHQITCSMPTNIPAQKLPYSGLYPSVSKPFCISDQVYC